MIKVLSAQSRLCACCELTTRQKWWVPKIEMFPWSSESTLAQETFFTCVEHEFDGSRGVLSLVQWVHRAQDHVLGAKAARPIFSTRPPFNGHEKRYLIVA
jgi:hypothetical protein